jgi:hypothetical protein
LKRKNWVFMCVDFLMTKMYVFWGVCVCVCVNPPTFFLQLCACFVCCWWLQKLKKTKPTKTKPWQSTWRIEWRDELWFPSCTHYLMTSVPNVDWILTSLFVDSNFHITFLFCFWCFRMPSSNNNPFTQRTWLSHSSSKSDLGFMLLHITSKWPLIDTRSKY